jgi:predicted dithiol-disulfide oxidoreductase (DUF899 family)
MFAAARLAERLKSQEEQPMGSLHDVRFPGESDEYRDARDELLRAEIALRQQIGRVAAQRRELPLGGEVQTDYEFEECDEAAGGARAVRLSELFEPGKDTLFLYSFMFVPESQGLGFVGPCPSCTSIIDGIDGQLPHIERRTSFAAAAIGPIDELHAHAQSRGWRHVRFLSSRGSTYNHDYGAADDGGNQWPLATVFARRDGKIHHFWTSELFFLPSEQGQDPRHVDFMWPMWAMYDRTPDGRGEHHPALDYD